MGKRSGELAVRGRTTHYNSDGKRSVRRGRFWGKASHFKNVQVVDESNKLRNPENLQVFTDQENCYNVKSGNGGSWGSHFYYGGPVASIAIRVDGNEFSHHQEVKMRRHLKRLNKPPVKSIKSEDGDVIDCVPITKQPAFDHPLLKHHTIQMRPSSNPKSDSKYTKKEAKTITQVWHKAGECPNNTVPIRRTKIEDLLRPKSIESFGRKPHHSIPKTTTFDPTKGHQYAIMSAMNETFYGTEVVLNLWKPYVQVPDEFSLAQTWIVSGSGSSLNTIEAGWQVYPELYDDYNPRFFVYWTDRETGNWWLSLFNDIIGYWPGSLFTSLGDGATIVQWGGEIVNLETGGKHTSTDMGSGHFADEGFEKASYVRNLKIVDGTNTLREPKSLYYFADKHNCYNVKTGNLGTSGGISFFYGGPGRNAKCP
ncbi:hypothetical protein Bca101_041277 [Brassica carinata]